ncbi:helicase [Streptomyces sp. CB01201]|nr:helicase [Streptomyces sp. CB01201]
MIGRRIGRSAAIGRREGRPAVIGRQEGRLAVAGGRGDRGSATVWVALTAATMCAVFAAVLCLGQAIAARHRAGGAADLAALAAADRALWGAPDACAKALEVARAQGAELVRCTVTGEIADVRARAGFGPYRPSVRARAGPPPALAGPAPGLPAAVP